MLEALPILADAAACLLLLSVIVEDLRSFRIRNRVVVGLLALSALHLAVGPGLDVLGAHTVFGGAALALMAVAFWSGVLGAGDAKLLATACFRVGAGDAVVFALALLVLTLPYCLGAGLGWLPARRRNGRLQIPFGPSIAGAWILSIVILQST